MSLKDRRLMAAMAIAWLGLLHGIPAHADCLDAAAVYHGVDALLLRAIATHESGMRANVTNRNQDGSEDVGLMQINSMHLPRLARYGITKASLFDPCVNAYVGAWILKENFVRYGSTWEAVGAYNAGSVGKRRQYAARIHNVLRAARMR